MRRLVARHFRVYDAREERVRGEVAARLFYLMFAPGEFDARFEALRRDLRTVDPESIAFVRRDGGEDVLYVARRPPATPRRARLHLVLLVLTLATTVTTGALHWHGYQDAEKSWDWSIFWSPTHLFWGFVAFALPLLLILGIHETAHYLAARRHGLRATLPFFLPFPPILSPPIGTLGAFISMKDPLPDRKALFDVGASGPIAGFLVALPVILLGAWLTVTVAHPIPDLDRPLLEADRAFMLDEGTPGKAVLLVQDASAGITSFAVTAPLDFEGKGKWSYEASARITLANGTERRDSFTSSLAGGESERRTIAIPDDAEKVRLVVTWEDSLVSFGDPLLVKALHQVPMFKGDEFLAHPTFFAGWVGLLVTAINLLPIGQLDGGHVARAVFGDKMRYVAYAALGVMVYSALRFEGWMLLLFFVLLLGIQHPPPLNDRTGLGTRRKVMAAVVLIVFALCFVPRPFIA